MKREVNRNLDDGIDKKLSEGNRVRSMIIAIFKVGCSNIFVLIASILVGFIIPKIMSVTEYGYYKQFNLYCTYIGLASIGIADGIALKFGNYNLDMLDYRYFRSIFRCFGILQVMMGGILTVLALLFFLPDMKFIAIAVGINMIPMNIVGYFYQISQITQRFDECVKRNVLNSVFSVLAVVIMLIMYLQTSYSYHQVYIVLILIINGILMMWYMRTYRTLIFGNVLSSKESIKSVVKLIKFGFPLMCANLCSVLILNIDRQFVSILFHTDEYAVYAFAYNLLSMVTTIVSACATVIYPALKRTNEGALKDNYQTLVFIVLAVCFLLAGINYPLCLFIRWYLPNYVGAIEILRIIFPSLAVMSAITIVIQNYYKTLQLSTHFFKKSFAVIVISVVANVFAYLICPEMRAISIVSVFVTLFWFVYTDRFVRKKLNIKSHVNFGYIVFAMLIFYLVSCVRSAIVGMIVYEVSILMCTLLWGKRYIENIYQMVVQYK